MLRMDNATGIYFTDSGRWAEMHAVKLEFIKPGKPTQNAFIERFEGFFGGSKMKCSMAETGRANAGKIYLLPGQVHTLV